MTTTATTNSQVVLITGCSSGFGRALVTEALASGRSLRVIATARRLETIADLHEMGAKTLALDITADQASLRCFAEEAVELFGQIDILVNNAGFLQAGAMEEVSPNELQDQFGTNLFGTINLTNAFLPHFRQRRTGLIVNISSMCAYFAYPGAGVYGATKAALDYTSKIWTKELAPFNVRSISISAGQFRTSVATAMRYPSIEIDAYKGLHAVRDQYRANSGKEPGDTGKAVKKILDLVTSSVNEELPARVALGEDAVALLDADIQTQIKDMEKWREFGKGTNADV